jgi:serine/threonine protein kinase
MDLIAGRYKLIRRLGIGGMAEVWLAEQQGPDGFVRRTVIKRVHAHLAEQEGFILSFKDEARVAARLHHPHIVKVEDYGEDEGMPYLVLEWVDGRDLSSLANETNGQEQRLPTRLTLSMGVQMAEALDYVHKLADDQGGALQIVHRDVSPQNIMMTTTGQAKLLDFGVARAATNEVHTRTGVLKGKIAYLSPEQAKAQVATPKSDQFSLGVVLWELLIGSRLFASESDISTLQRVVFGDIPSIAVLGGRLPSPLVRAIDRCLHRDPAERFTDCGELAQALRLNLGELGGPFTPDEYKGFLDELAATNSLPKPLPFLSPEARSRTESHEAIRGEEPATENELRALPDAEPMTVIRRQVSAAPGSEDATLMHPSLTSTSTSQLSVHQITGTQPQTPIEEVTQVTEARRLSEATVSAVASATHGGHLAAFTLAAAAALGVAVIAWPGEDRPTAEAIAALERPVEVLAEPGAPPKVPDEDNLNRRTARLQRQLRACRGPGVSGPPRLKITLTLDPAGGAPKADIPAADNALRSCLLNAISGWDYPAFSGPSKTHRIVFRLR